MSKNTIIADPDVQLINEQKVLAEILILGVFTYDKLAQLAKVPYHEVFRIMLSDFYLDKFDIVFLTDDISRTSRRIRKDEKENLKTRFKEIEENLLETETFQRMVEKNLITKPSLDDPEIRSDFHLVRSLVKNCKEKVEGTLGELWFAKMNLGNLEYKCRPLFAYYAGSDTIRQMQEEINGFRTAINEMNEEAMKDPEVLLLKEYRLISRMVSLRKFTFQEITEVTNTTYEDLCRVISKYDLVNQIPVTQADSDVNCSVRILNNDAAESLITVMEKLWNQFMNTKTVHKFVKLELWDEPRADDPSILQSLKLAWGFVDGCMKSKLLKESEINLALSYVKSAEASCQTYFVYAPESAKTKELKETLNYYKNLLLEAKNLIAQTI